MKKFEFYPDGLKPRLQVHVVVHRNLKQPHFDQTAIGSHAIDSVLKGELQTVGPTFLCKTSRCVQRNATKIRNLAIPNPISSR